MKIIYIYIFFFCKILIFIYFFWEYNRKWKFAVNGIGSSSDNATSRESVWHVRKEGAANVTDDSLHYPTR